MAGWPRHAALQSADGTAAPRRAPDVTLPAVRMAWVDYGGQLHLGNLASRDQHVVATVDASPADPMIQAGGHLYWADSNTGAAPVRDYDIATGRIRYLARGDSVFASADRRHIFIAEAATKLIELPAHGIGRPWPLVLPAGWHLSGGLGNWSVAGGIVIYSGPADARRGLPEVGVWNPGTGQVKIIGRAFDVLETFYPAWGPLQPPGLEQRLPARLPAGHHQHLHPGQRDRAQPSPLRLHVWRPVLQRRLLPRREAPGGVRGHEQPARPLRQPYSVLGIVSTSTGVLRLVPRPTW